MAHDELIYEVAVADKEVVAKVVYECMTQAWKLAVPLEVECQEGTRWGVKRQDCRA